jgi:hypothetical protein
MPTPPRKGETQSEFIGRCVPVVIREGRPKDQAVAICYSMWRRSKKHSIYESLYKSLERIQLLLDKCK